MTFWPRRGGFDFIVIALRSSERFHVIEKFGVVGNGFAALFGNHAEIQLRFRFEAHFGDAFAEIHGNAVGAGKIVLFLK